MARVLLIGGTGLISGGVLAQCLSAGHEVTLVTRGTVPVPAGARHVAADRSDPAQLRRAFDRDYDAVVDCICYAPADARAVTEMAGGRAAQYIFASTVDVYPKPAPQYPVREDLPRVASMKFAYAADKVRCEEIIEAQGAALGFATTIIRPAATYGDASDPLAPPVFRNSQLYVDRLLDGQPIILHGDGSGLWLSAHRDDVAAAFVAAIGNRKAFGKAYNATGSEAMTWNRYWETVAEVIGAPAPEIVHVPTDILVRLMPQLAEWVGLNFQFPNVYDNGAAAADLEYRPRVTWRDGLERMRLRERPRYARQPVIAEFERALARWQQMVAGAAPVGAEP